ncbi:hypothetical protein ABEX47_19270 [Paenibacillus ehimensis]|uniref:hypothetical protein n=1 Tax=Paenibacillus ehimensis TaxID=79264 RepID=UPI003D294722
MAAGVSWDKSLHHVTVNAPQAGLYEIAVDYAWIPDKLYPTEHGIQINGKCPFYEARRIVIAKIWADQKAAFEQDTPGNEITPRQRQLKQWQTTPLRDASYLNDEPL